MDYKEKYEQALDNLMIIKAENKDNKELVDFIENKYPELKESEDERNIKDLIDELKCSLRAANCQNDACGGGYEKRIALLEWSIAWLEKQGNQESDLIKIAPQKRLSLPSSTNSAARERGSAIPTSLPILSNL